MFTEHPTMPVSEMHGLHSLQKVLYSAFYSLILGGQVMVCCTNISNICSRGMVPMSSRRAKCCPRTYLVSLCVCNQVFNHPKLPKKYLDNLHPVSPVNLNKFGNSVLGL